MFGTLLKKKISNDKLANIFINGIFTSIDNSFSLVSDFINDDPAFVQSPNINPLDSYEFSLIVLIGNISNLESSFPPEQADGIAEIIYDKLARMYEMNTSEFKQMLRDYRTFINRLNSPSKNMVYGMSKAIFDKYTLYNYQDEYFKRMQTPNPLFLKRMDSIVENFIWNWDTFFKKHKMESSRQVR